MALAAGPAMPSIRRRIMKLGSAIFTVLMAVGTSAVLAADRLFVDGDTVREVQQTLRDRGFRVGVDGIMGPRTQAVLRQFQKAENLEPTGQLNRQTLVALGIVEAASAGATPPPQYGPDILRKAQATLNARGFRAGPANGRMNPQTRQAIRQFQRSENLEETGRLNPGTLAALGMEAESVASGAGGSR
jgi:peptidoglycan hydrolase-like protein with peptidoglycan-binding domain